MLIERDESFIGLLQRFRHPLFVGGHGGFVFCFSMEINCVWIRELLLNFLRIPMTANKIV